MRYLAVPFAALALAACSTTLVTRSEPKGAGHAHGLATEMQDASTDAALQFLLTSAAADFHVHRASDPVRFRDVRFGHVMTPNGAEQYMLCGEFKPAREGDNAGWMPFATIKTSGYEQWLGAQAAGLCQRPSITWNKPDDLSPLLQGKLDSLR